MMFQKEDSDSTHIYIVLVKPVGEIFSKRMHSFLFL